ncbi:PqqD family protein [candidate division KSB1 bacterium]
MNINNKLRINTPHIVYDTIDDETILVNLKSGNYYSLDKFGLLIWDIIVSKGDLFKFIELVSWKYQLPSDKISSDIENFIQKLFNENLIIPDNGNSSDHTSMTKKEIDDKLKELGSGFEAPVLNKYSDMQEVLLLDPIHDTDEEKGWPSPKEVD